MKVLWIWIRAFILTFVSGLYIVNSPYGELGFGFPSNWLIASRSIGVQASWSFNFLWSWFIVDLAIYALLVTAATWIYEKKLKLVSNRNIYRISFLLFNVILVICCLVFIIWMLLLNFGVVNPSSIGYNIYFGIWTWLRFLLGFMAVIVTWFLIKYFKRVSTP
jgi:hypothetical protein